MKVNDGVPSTIELELGDIETPIQDLIDEQSFYKVTDVTVYNELTETISVPTYVLSGVDVLKNHTVTTKPLQTLKDEQKREIERSFFNAQNDEFHTNGVKLLSTIQNVLTFRLLVQHAEDLGETQVNFVDFNNHQATVSLPIAKNMVQDITTNFCVLDNTRGMRFSSIDAATSAAAVLNIIW